MTVNYYRKCIKKKKKIRTKEGEKNGHICDILLVGIIITWHAVIREISPNFDSIDILYYNEKVN